ncbi:MAG: YfhO family protein [Proteobacteria bacterium]|nr:YfhO family protein [Pseudomonadota bacterium]
MLQRLSRKKNAASSKEDAAFVYSPGRPASANRQWFAVIGLLLAVSGLLCWPWLLGQVTIPWDAKAHFQAQIAFLAQSIHSGQSPFWAPYVFSGHPQIADPQSLIFSPGFVLLALFTPNPGFAMVDGVVFANLVFGALGMIGFARDRRWHPAAAIIAALCFAYGGSAAWRIQHVGQILSLTFFPWALWMLERGLRLSSARYGALSGLFAGLMVLGPDQVAYLGLIALTLFTLAHIVSGPGMPARMRAAIRPLFSGAVIGGAIISVQLLMVLTFADGSNRAQFGFDEAAKGSLHPSSLLTFVIANLFGTIGPNEEFWGAPSVHWPYIVDSNVARNMANFYMGALPLIAALGWLTSRLAYARRMVTFTLIFGVMLAYALGRYTPVFGTLYALLPGVDLFRRPADATFLIGALGAILAGFGLNALLSAPQGTALRRVLLVAGLFAALSLCAGLGMALWLGKTTSALPEIGIAMATFGASALALVYACRHARAHPMRAAAILAATLAADLAWNIRPNDSTGLPPSVYAELRPDAPNETLDFLKAHVVRSDTRRDRVELVGLGFEWPNIGLIHKLENTLGYNPLRVASYAAAAGAPDQVASPEQRKFSPLFWGYRSPFANLLGLRYIATSVPIEKIDPALGESALPLVARTAEGYIYENPDALPRVMIVPEAQATDQDWLISSGEWPSTDLTKVAFVEPSALPLPRRNFRGGTSAARITRYTNTEVEIEVSASRGGVLLLNDIWHPWWFAEIDGKPAKVLRANGVFRAVILPAGAQKVVFTFEPMRGLIRRYLLKRGLISG